MTEIATGHSEYASLAIPDVLVPSPDRQLPVPTLDTLTELRSNGWTDLGIMVPIIDTEGSILSLNHNGRRKNIRNALGPLGETLEEVNGRLEHPLEALHRGLTEELGIINPGTLPLHMFAAGGWTINRWPKGLMYPGQTNCAIVFPVFLDDYAKAQLMAQSNLPTQEIISMQFLPPAELLRAPDESLRHGVKQWLIQTQAEHLLDPASRELVLMQGASQEIGA